MATAPVNHKLLAVQALMKLTPQLSGFASAMADRKITVKPGDATKSTADVIYIAPPLSLGKPSYHDRSLCDERDDVSRMLLCEACAKNEYIVAMFFHEISHVVFQSLGDGRRSELFDLARRVVPSDLGKSRMNMNLSDVPGHVKSPFAINPHLNKFSPILFNVVEDVRVDSQMLSKRPGLHEVQYAQYYNAIHSQTETISSMKKEDGTLAKFVDMELNTQMSVAVLVKAKGFPIDSSLFHEYVLDCLGDPKVDGIIDEIAVARNIEDSFMLSTKLLVELQRLGFYVYDAQHCYIDDEEPEDEKPEDDEGGEGEPEPGDSEDSSDDSSDDAGGDSDGGSASGDDSKDDESPADDDHEDDDSSDEGDSPDEEGEAPLDEGGSGDRDEEVSDGDDDSEKDGKDGKDGGDEASDDEPSGKDSDEGGDSEGGSSSDAEEGGGDSPDVADSMAGDGGADDATESEADPSDDVDGPVSPESGDGEPAEGGDSSLSGPSASFDPRDADFGTDEKAARELIEAITAHGSDGPEEDDERVDGKDAMEMAVGLEFFDTPSKNITGVRFIDRPRNSGDRTSGVDESLIASSLLHMRRVFADNMLKGLDSNRKSGRVNARVLGRRAWSADERLFSKKTMPKRKSYAVLIGIDMSGSTARAGGRTWESTIELERKAAMAQAELCHRLGVQFAVFGHTGGDHSLEIYVIKDWHQNWNDAAISRLNHIGPQAANLDGHTLLFYRKSIEKVQATHKIIMYYSDGAMPAGNYHEELSLLKKEIDTCKKRGYLLMGVGARTDAPNDHGLDTVRIDDASEIQKVVKHLGSRLEKL